MIVQGKPVVSQNKGAESIQWSDIKCHQSDITSREADREVDSLSDDGVGCSVKKAELEWRYRIRMKGVFINEGGIYETVGGTRVYKHGEEQSIVASFLVLVLFGLSPVWLQSFSSPRTGLSNTMYFYSNHQVVGPFRHTLPPPLVQMALESQISWMPSPPCLVCKECLSA